MCGRKGRRPSQERRAGDPMRAHASAELTFKYSMQHRRRTSHQYCDTCCGCGAPSRYLNRYALPMRCKPSLKGTDYSFTSTVTGVSVVVLKSDRR